MNNCNPFPPINGLIMNYDNHFPILIKDAVTILIPL